MNEKFYAELFKIEEVSGKFYIKMLHEENRGFVVGHWKYFYVGINSMRLTTSISSAMDFSTKEKAETFIETLMPK